MRYICPECGSFVKDKLIFGLLHFCIPDLSRQRTRVAINPATADAWDDVLNRYQQQGIQATPGEFMEMLSSGITPEELRRGEEGR